MIRPALSGGMDWWRMDRMAIFQSPKIIFQSTEICRKKPWNSADRAIFARFQAPKFENSEPAKCSSILPAIPYPPPCQISGSEIWKFRARKYAIPYSQPFHTPTRLPANDISRWRRRRRRERLPSSKQQQQQRKPTISQCRLVRAWARRGRPIFQCHLARASA